MKTPASLRSLNLLLCAATTAAALFLAACGQGNAPAAASGNNSAAPASAKTIHLAFIPKGMANVYWKSVEAGLRQAEKEAKDGGMKIDIDWNGPPYEGDRQGQISLMQNYVAEKKDGIILCPMDFDALVAPSEMAHSKGIPLVIVDSPLNYKEIVAFVGTDNSKAGMMAGKELAHELGDKGNVILMRYLPGSASTNQREDGFLAEMKNHPGIKVLSSDNFAGDTREKALEKGSNLLNTYKAQGIDGVFTPNEPSTNGMLLALQQAGLAGKTKFVGFDGGAANMQGFNSGQINALILQDPYTMGYKGVKTMLDQLAGKKPDANVDTGTVLLTKETQDSQQVKDLLKHTIQ